MFGQSRSVPVLVVHVRHMRMRVFQPTVAVRVRVGFAGRVLRPMAVLMVLVMHMRMRVHQWFMYMLMLVVLGHMQPDSNRHQNTGDNEGDGYGLAEGDNSDDGAKKWGG
jgi:hypothetical protein